MADNSKATDIPANKMRLADRIKKVRDGLRLHMYGEYTEDKGGKVEVAELERNGKVEGRYVQKDGHVVETHGSPEAQATGAHAAAAKAAGIKAEDIRNTSTTQVSEDMGDHSERHGEGAQKIGELGAKTEDGPGKPEKNESVKLTTGKTVEHKPKDPKSGKAPDKSMSTMGKQKNGEVQGGPDLTKSGLAKAYTITSKPGEIKYTKQAPNAEPQAGSMTTPPKPKWKERWDAKSPKEKMAFNAHLADQRTQKAKPTTKQPTPVKMGYPVAPKPAAAAPAAPTPTAPAAPAAPKAPAPAVPTAAKKSEGMHKAGTDDLSERAARIRASMEKITRLMTELKGLSDAPENQPAPTASTAPKVPGQKGHLKLVKADDDNVKPLRPVGGGEKKKPTPTAAPADQSGKWDILGRKAKPATGGSVDAKIRRALEAQPDNPYAQTRHDRGVGGYGTQDRKHQDPKHAEAMRRQKNGEGAPKKEEPPKRELPNHAKPIQVAELSRYSKHTASGRPFQVMMGMNDRHRRNYGAHHELEQPMTLTQVRQELRNPTSKLARAVVDATERRHDTLYVHQPSGGGGKQVGHLKVMKSGGDGIERYPTISPMGSDHDENSHGVVRRIAEHMRKSASLEKCCGPMTEKLRKLKGTLRKNATMGYPAQGVPPDGSVGANPPAAPMAMSMSKAEDHSENKPVPASHEDYAKQVARDVRDLVTKRGAAKLEKDAEAKRFQQPNNPRIRSLADTYTRSKGMVMNHALPSAEVNPEHATKIAQAYHAMPHTPNDPATKQAYDALIGETSDQFQHLLNHGLKVSKIQPGQENPYKNGSKDVFHDVHQNNHLWYYPTESGFGEAGSEHKDHPLLRNIQLPSGESMPANDMFRIVHDIFGHAKEGHGFGPKGEESAWQHHMQMYSPAAQRALTSETRGQNSWVNFGPHAAHNRQNPAQTKYAEQKAGLLPEWAMKR